MPASCESESQCEIPDTHITMMAWMEKVSKMISDGFEKHLQILQTEIFQIKTDLDKEKKKTERLSKENEGLRRDMKLAINEVNFLADRVEQLDQEKRQCDIVINNIDVSDVKEPVKFFQTVVNSTLMGEVVADSDILNATAIEKRKNNKMTLIGTLKNVATKKAILVQRKMFIKNNLYVKENLTPYKFSLFKSTREFARLEGYKYVWTKNGNVFIRRDENSNAVLVRNKGVLDTLFS